MPLIIDGGRVPPRWVERKGWPRTASLESPAPSQCIRIAFINNMPDSALEDTEMQFFELLEAAAGDIPVRISLHSLSGVPRSERGQHHLDSFYLPTDDLLDSRFDGVIMTGTEPRQPDLRNEPYWPALTDVLHWAESNTVSTILSCLAAHGGVLYSDGINRHPLSDKQFGVFTFGKTTDHPLMYGTGEPVRFPHSRWNEVREDALKACGYLVLTRSVGGGVDSFVKMKKQSLFVHFQGHPEYAAETLLKEYRRDVRRFVRGERATYPSMPEGYFGASSARLVTDFKDVVLSGGRGEPREDLMEGFPEAALAGTLQKTWHSSATGIYRNWLGYVASKKAVIPEFSAVAAGHGDVQRKRSSSSSEQKKGRVASK